MKNSKNKISKLQNKAYHKFMKNLYDFEILECECGGTSYFSTDDVVDVITTLKYWSEKSKMIFNYVTNLWNPEAVVSNSAGTKFTSGWEIIEDKLIVGAVNSNYVDNTKGEAWDEILGVRMDDKYKDLNIIHCGNYVFVNELCGEDDLYVWKRKVRKMGGVFIFDHKSQLETCYAIFCEPWLAEKFVKSEWKLTDGAGWAEIDGKDKEWHDEFMTKLTA